MKPLAAVFTFLFALFAWFQLNDPDAGAWVILYVALALLSAFSDTGKIKRPLMIALLFCGAGMLNYIPGLFEFFTNRDGIAFTDGMSNEFQYIEQAREFGGLLISSVVMYVLYRRQA